LHGPFEREPGSYDDSTAMKPGRPTIDVLMADTISTEFTSDALADSTIGYWLIEQHGGEAERKRPT
jgi:hypothetical protein